MIKIGDYVRTSGYYDSDSTAIREPSLVIASIDDNSYFLVLIDNPKHYSAWVLSPSQIDHYRINESGKLIDNISDFYLKKVYWYYAGNLVVVENDVDLIFPNGFMVRKRIYPKLGAIYKSQDQTKFEIAELSEDKTTAWLEYI